MQISSFQTLWSRCMLGVAAVAFVVGCGAAPVANGQDFVYQPTNPAFGGIPSNFQVLLQSAQQQNPFQDDQRFGSFRDDPLQNFQQRLERQVLDQLSREIIQQRFGDQVDLTQEGRFTLQNFTVDVNPDARGISIRIFNRNTGEESTIEIPRF
jgi:curli production assembly/transport component CsgF